MVVDWGEIAREVSGRHKDEGSSVVSIGDSELGDALIDVSPSHLTMAGREVAPRRIRGYLWENRKTPRLRRPGSVVWSLYDEEEDVSFVGIGLMVERRVGARMQGMFPERLVSVRSV